MKIEISEYYKRKGVKRLYLLKNRENRRFVSMVYENNERHSMSYAKYLYTSYYNCDVADSDEVDHINGDRMDDRIENLQVISRKLNKNKSKIRKTMIVRECPICHKKFLFELRNLSTHPNPCCSKKMWRNK